MRVQQIMQIGAIEGDKLLSANEMEQVKRSQGGIQRWIDDNMYYKSCVIVLIGSRTANRPWVQYEIKKGWEDGKGLLGVYVHNLRDPRTSDLPPFYGRSIQGINPFELFYLDNGKKLSSVVPCFNPGRSNTYSAIANNIESLVERAIRIRQYFLKRGL